MKYENANQAKATFDDVYHAPTPHGYFAEMDRLDYQIGEEARPYIVAAIEHLADANPADLQPRILDLGCSYGVGSALVKHACSYRELSRFFRLEAPQDPEPCAKACRSWLSEKDVHPEQSFVGLDRSSEAVDFAEQAGLITHGIAKNFEEGDAPTREDEKAIRRCNFLMSTGAIGYVGEKTLSRILPLLGQAYPENVAPFVVVTILRMFDPLPIQECFFKHGFRFERLPEVRLRQRRFADREEMAKTVAILRERRGIDPVSWEDSGYLYADVYVGARASDFNGLAAKLRSVKSAL